MPKPHCGSAWLKKSQKEWDLRLNFAIVPRQLDFFYVIVLSDPVDRGNRFSLVRRLVCITIYSG